MRIIGDGGHARVVREIIEQYEIGWFTYKHAVVAVGDNMARKREVENCDGRLVTFPVLISKHAVVSRETTIGSGTVIMAGAIIQVGARIGKHVIINTGATVDHDCIIGDYAHIAPGAHLCGHVEVGEGALIGAGVCVAPMGKIPAWTLAKMRRLELVSLSNHC